MVRRDQNTLPDTLYYDDIHEKNDDKRTDTIESGSFIMQTNELNYLMKCVCVYCSMYNHI